MDMGVVEKTNSLEINIRNHREMSEKILRYSTTQNPLLI
jgi:hypothetical protein